MNIISRNYKDNEGREIYNTHFYSNDILFLLLNLLWFIATLWKIKKKRCKTHLYSICNRSYCQKSHDLLLFMKYMINNLIFIYNIASHIIICQCSCSHFVWQVWYCVSSRRFCFWIYWEHAKMFFIFALYERANTITRRKWDIHYSSSSCIVNRFCFQYL